MSQPSVPGPQGGVTMERTLLDPKISSQVQGAFTGGLTGLQNQVGNLPGQMQYAGMFEPGRLDLKEASPFSYSKNLDPLVQSMLSGAQQETAEALGTKNAQIAENLRRAPGNNQALISTLQSENARESALTSNPYRLNALSAQRAMDAEKYGLNLQGTSLTNQARTGERSADERVAQINAGTIAQNNQARLSSISPQMQMVGMLGQGLVQTTPRAQASLTMDDIEKLRDNPEMINMALQSGLVDAQTLQNAGISTGLTADQQATMNAYQQLNQQRAWANNPVLRNSPYLGMM